MNNSSYLIGAPKRIVRSQSKRRSPKRIVRRKSKRKSRR